MSQQKEKIKYLLPGDKAPLDTTVKLVYVGTAIFIGLFISLIAINVIFLMLWRNLPFLPLPPSTNSAFFHLKGFWKVLIPYFNLGEYGEYIYKWKKHDLLDLLGWRYLISIIGGLGLGILAFLGALKPQGGVKHVAGKIVLRGKEAFNDLLREFTFLSKNGRGSGLIVASKGKYDPTVHTIEDLKPGSFIELPEKIRRSHNMIAGGTGRGKTQVIYYRLVAPLYTKIRKGEKIKLLIADTPKSDYSRYFHSKHVFIIGPAEDGTVVWNISKDLSDGLLANAFWTGKIPTNDQDPVWSKAAVAMGTGCTRFLQVVAPKAWNYGMLAYMLGMTGEELQPVITEHYPEANQMVRAAGETLSSVMFNLGTYTTDIVNLGRIHDGFEIKKPIKQATAKALRNEAYIKFVSNEMLKAGVNQNKDPDNVTRELMFRATCRYLNKTNPEWTWKDFAEFVKQSRFKQSELASPFLDEKEGKIVKDLDFGVFWKELAQHIVHYADEWDKLESTPRLSIRDWITNENPGRKILILKPSETYPTLTEGLIKGILYYANSVILGRLQDDKNRKFHILIDEFQSYGNIEPFVSPALSLYRSRGVSVTLAFQDLAQLVKIYGQEFVDFMNSNIGNIIITGVNDGFTANKLTELLGQKKIQKLHRHKNADGGSSEDLQEHDEKVIFENEWNLLGANDAKMHITYLNLFGGLNPAYILESPIIPYKVRNMPKPAKWVDADEPGIPTLPSLDIEWEFGKVAPTAVEDKDSMDWVDIDPNNGPMFDEEDEQKEKTE